MHKLSRPGTEGCLISVSRRGRGAVAGNGGVGDAALAPGGSKPRSSRRIDVASRALTADTAGALSAGVGANGWSSTVEGRPRALKRSTTGDRRGANLKHRARDALGFGGLAALHKDFDKPRCREASRPVGPSGPLASRAPSVLFRAGGRSLECRRSRRLSKNSGR